MTARRAVLAGLRDSVDTRTTLMAMIDVVFLLMIFFLFGFGPIRERELVATLAERSVRRQDAVGETVWLSLRPGSEGTIEYRVNGGGWVSSELDTRASLARALELPASDGSVTVDPSQGLPFQAVVDALGMAERCGAASSAMRTD